jgi:hypothetical protein
MNGSAELHRRSRSAGWLGAQPARRVPTNVGPAIRAGNNRKDPTPPKRATSSAEESAMLRDQLIMDLDRLQSSEEAADWVNKSVACTAPLMRHDIFAVASDRSVIANFVCAVRMSKTGDRGIVAHEVTNSAVSSCYAVPWEQS